MKKITIALMMTFALIIGMVTTAQAETNPMNFFKGIKNAAAGAVYCVLNTPENMYDGTVNDGLLGLISGFGDVTRAVPKAVEEIGYGLAWQETERAVTDKGIINQAIEENAFAHGLRNGIGVGVATGGIAIANCSSWTSAVQAAVWVGTPVAIGTVGNHHMNGGR